MQHAANDDIAEKRSQRDSHLMFRLLEKKKNVEGRLKKESLSRYLSCHVVVVWDGAKESLEFKLLPESETERISGRTHTGKRKNSFALE